MNRIGLADLAAQHRELGAELEAAMRRVVEGGRFVLGEEVERFEQAVGAALGVSHAIGVSSGTDALLLALGAAGVDEGDDVITTPFSFVATAECVARLGARAVFVDVEPRTLCLDPERVEAAFTSRTRAVLPVHLFGAPARADRLAALCAARGVALVEDAAQAFGTTAQGRAAGTWGTAGCFSFFPGKVLGALGDGGLVVTADSRIAERCRSLRQHGRADDGRYRWLGGNHRLDALQAAFLGVKLPRSSRYIETRRRHGAAYDAGLSGLAGVTPVERDAGWNGAVYTVRVHGGRRDALRAALHARNIDSAVYYSTPLHLEPAFARLGHAAGAFPVSERAAREVLSLPVHAELASGAVERVVEAIREFDAG